MKLKVKNIPIRTGKANIALMNEVDSMKHDLLPSDRIKVFYRNKEMIVAVDVTKDKSMPPGYIYIMEEVSNYLNVKNNKIIRFEMAQKPISTKYIRKKLSGEELSKAEIFTIVNDIVKGNLCL
jgi:AMP phosphorylase